MNKKILIFTATYNEAENISQYLNLILNMGKEYDILIVDDNSPDNTWKIVEEFSLKNKNIYLHIRKKEGLTPRINMHLNLLKKKIMIT